MLIFINLVSSIILRDNCTKPGLISITFDDGPTEYTPYILEDLEDLKCKATFHFATNVRSRGNIRGVYQRAANDGHEVGLRVHPGRDYDSMNPEEIEEDIENQIEVISRAIGKKIKCARAQVDNGKVNRSVYDAFVKNDVIQTGYTYCLYDYASDGSTERMIELYEEIISNSNPKYDSFIFLLHDKLEEECPLLSEMVKIGRKYKYKFVTLSQCLEGHHPGDDNSSDDFISGGKPRVDGGNLAGKHSIIPLTIFSLLSL